MKPLNLRLSPAELWFAVRLGVWLCFLPILLSICSLPKLLQHFTAGGRAARKNALQMDRAVAIVVRLCQMRLFRLPIFPRACLRQSLALYHTLTRMGYPVEIHFGVHKDGEELRGHSWVTMQGKPVAETPTEIFQIVYSYPFASPLPSPDGGWIERGAQRRYEAEATVHHVHYYGSGTVRCEREA